MTLLNLWGLAGLAAIAVPILIHLFGRQRARLVRFPSLRFLPDLRLLPTRRRRLDDLLVLVIRCAVLVAAALAGARPFFHGKAATEQAARAFARAIVVDTSASMRRPLGVGTALDSARRIVAAEQAGAAQNAVIETAHPSAAIAGAVEWLGHQDGRRELVVVSDFQLGVIDPVEVARVPSADGVRLIAVNPAAASASTRSSIDRSVSATPVTAGTRAEWRSESSVGASTGLTLVGSSAELARADAARSAARIVAGDIRPDSGHPVAIIYMNAAGRADLVTAARPIDRAWMGGAVSRLASTPELRSAAASLSDSLPPPMDTSRFAVVARDEAHRPVVLASAGRVGSADALELWVLADPGSSLSAQLFAALRPALAGPFDAIESEVQSIPAATLTRWQREPGVVGNVGAQSDASDGRWLWLAALVLLALEWVVRRDRRIRESATSATPDEELARVA